MFFCSKKSIALVVAVVAVLMTDKAMGQDDNEVAMGLVASAMDSYSNLEMDQAKNLLNQAVAMEGSLNEQTRAKIHVSFGVLWMGGYSDNVQAEESFITAICLDPDVRVDPLFSTPDIDTMFNRARQLATQELCAQKGLVEVVLPPCGEHEPLGEQKRYFELPFYIELSPDMRSKVSSISVQYLYDSNSDYNSLEMQPTGSGYGAKLDCDRGAMLLVDPSTVSYYIEGVDLNGLPVCSNGSAKEPLGIVYGEDVSPLPPIAGIIAKECIECGPLDEECRKRKAAAERGNKQAGETCTVTSECAVGLVCTDSFYCQEGEASEEKPVEPETPKGKAPSRFYTHATAGSGFGVISKKMNIRRAQFGSDGTPGNQIPDPRDFIGDYDGEGEGAIIDVSKPVNGATWNGVPIRLTVGVHITPKLSVEVAGRLDAYIVTVFEPVSCLEAAGGDINKMVDITENPDGTFTNNNPDACNLDWANLYPGTPSGYNDLNEEQKLTLGEHAVAQDENGHTVTKSKKQVAWLITARARYLLAAKGGLKTTVFGGAGYGHAQYLVNSKSGEDIYFPRIGMAAIEVGAGLAYYFNSYVGLVFDLPITFIVGDGFAANFDFNLGLGVGF